ncbi:MAG: P-II family nitrogen regulator [Acidobacteria bacterium]|nr:P-II family nitrogen regulator [Acidobacteriota bacterium]
MQFRKITAIVRQERLADVEHRLVELGVPGITVAPVHGFGEYANYFRGDLLVPHVRIEIFTTPDRVESIASVILDAASTGCEGDGLLAVLPVEQLIRVRTKGAVDPDAG